MENDAAYAYMATKLAMAYFAFMSGAIAIMFPVVLIPTGGLAAAVLATNHYEGKHEKASAEHLINANDIARKLRALGCEVKFTSRTEP
jgi:hypothetical protein